MKGRRPLIRHRGDLNRRSSRLNRIFFEVPINYYHDGRLIAVDSVNRPGEQTAWPEIAFRSAETNKQTICLNVFGEPTSYHRHSLRIMGCCLAEARPWSMIERACDLAPISKQPSIALLRRNEP
jgi:hypothetical protein